MTHCAKLVLAAGALLAGCSGGPQSAPQVPVPAPVASGPLQTSSITIVIGPASSGSSSNSRAPQQVRHPSEIVVSAVSFHLTDTTPTGTIISEACIDRAVGSSSTYATLGAVPGTNHVQVDEFNARGCGGTLLGGGFTDVQVTPGGPNTANVAIVPKVTGIGVNFSNPFTVLQSVSVVQTPQYEVLGGQPVPFTVFPTDPDGNRVSASNLKSAGVTSSQSQGITLVQPFAPNFTGSVQFGQIYSNPARLTFNATSNALNQFFLGTDMTASALLYLFDTTGTVKLFDSSPNGDVTSRFPNAFAGFHVDSLAYGGANDLYAVDRVANKVSKFTRDGTLVPSATFAAFQPYAAAGFRGPGSYYLYVIDYKTSATNSTPTIRVFDPGGNAYSTPGGFPGLVQPIGLAGCRFMLDSVNRQVLTVLDRGSPAQPLKFYYTDGTAYPGFTTFQWGGISNPTGLDCNDYFGSGSIDVTNNNTTAPLVNCFPGGTQFTCSPNSASGLNGPLGISILPGGISTATSQTYAAIVNSTKFNNSYVTGYSRFSGIYSQSQVWFPSAGIGPYPGSKFTF